MASSDDLKCQTYANGQWHLSISAQVTFILLIAFFFYLDFVVIFMFTKLKTFQNNF